MRRWSLLIALLVSAGLVATARVPSQALALSFVLEEAKNQEGGIYASFGDPGSEVLLQNSSLLLLYGALVGDRPLVEEQAVAMERYFLDGRLGLLHWHLDGGMRPVAGSYANSPGDSLRAVRALILAYQRWHEEEHLRLALRIAEGLMRYNVAEDRTLRAYATWSDASPEPARADSVLLPHGDLVAMALLSPYDARWEEVLARTLSILLSGATEVGLFQLSYRAGAYSPGEGSMIAAAQTALQLASYGSRYGDPASLEAARRFLNFAKGQHERSGKVFARYDPESGTPLVDWENLAVYALVAQVALELGDSAFAETLISQHLLPKQNLDKGSPAYGAFTAHPNYAYVYDTLEALVALYLLEGRPGPREDEPIRAVWYLGWERESYLKPQVKEELKEIQARLCPNYIGLFAIVYQEGKTSSDPHRDPARTATDAALRQVITQIHRLGMGVILLTPLFPDDGTWEGAIQPQDVEAWFDHWRGILLHYAQLAEETGVEVLLLGSELATLRTRTDDWNRLILAVRSKFHGKVSYSVNFWANRQEYAEVMAMTYWRHLDYIGVTGYFELTEKKDPTVEELEAGWYRDRVGQNVVADLEGLSGKYGKPIVFWEIGYQSKDGTSMYPWNFPRPGAEDEGEQADAWQAFLNVFRDKDWFFGYGVYAEHVGLPKVAKMYTVLGKRAESVLASECR
ncbi:MAG: hypothetical protein XD60_0951 [Acetothermia bacterium 64_32]|nr:MAG: hypothetical protein XD60_0951 [Acetothermia bacterium 64_32]HAF70134.1 hypothetical protein [Candidatus Acetothermia bacterium]